ncbi:MAG TPA: threonine-phosphate decarboxylase CobD [Methylomirabilota bacterium]|nr:threonine-phosphate decarboxylase CobD [Methylomirabilota bacterium]
MIKKATGNRQQATGKNPPLRQNQALSNQRPFSHGGNVYAFARALDVEFDDVLDFSASINPLGMPRGARLAYRQALHRVMHYPEPHAESLVQALAAYHDVNPACLLAGNGSTQLIYTVARAFHPRRVLLIAPLFSEHAAAFRASGAQVEHFILRPPTFALALESLERRLRATPYDVLVLTNPNSPTGALVLHEQVSELVRLCRRMRTRLLVDETFIDWVEGETVKKLAARDANVLVLRSMTKFFVLPGLRIGYAIAPPRVVQQLREQIEPWSINVAAQEVGIACLQDRKFIERSRKFLHSERAWLYARLQAIPGLHVFSSQANFLLMQLLRQDITASELACRLAQDKLLIRVCDNFVGLGKQFVRIAVRRRAENRRLLEVLHTVGSSGINTMSRTGPGGRSGGTCA